MHVVRHEAVSRHGKCLAGGLCSEIRKKGGAQIMVEKILLPLETAEGNKVETATQIIWMGEANWPARERHGKKGGLGMNLL
jgi:hypothetical protein